MKLPNETVEAFHKHKKCLTESPVLAYPDISKPFNIFTDASIVAIEAVVEQEGHSIIFESRVINKADISYSTYEL